MIEKFTAESQEVTSQLPQNLTNIIKADIYAAITGLATPDGSERGDRPAGTVFFAVLLEGKLTPLKKIFRGTPLEIKKKACKQLYQLITGRN